MKKESALFRVARAACKIFAKIFYPYEVENGFSLPENERVVICCNHISNLDPVFLNLTQHRLIHFMAKSELFKFKPFGALIKKFGAFPVVRGNDGGKAIGTAEELLNEGHVVGIFLEGRRSRSGDLQKPHSGAVIIAHETNTKIVPACITGKNKFVNIFRKTKITYGKPVSCEELGITEGTNNEFRQASRKIMELISEMREEHLSSFSKQQ